ncbi:MAG: homocysteine S-methyltransferase family protein [Anaerolineae bacterium]
MSRFITSLNTRPVLVADGAMGTMLHKAGLLLGVAPERWNLENPAAVRAVYKAYLDAGADLILTNTFGGTPIRLEREGLHAQAYALNTAAAQLAREVVGDQALVLGDIGPTGQILEPLGTLPYAEAVRGFAVQAGALSESGVDAILIETMSDLGEAIAAIEGVRQATDLPILVTMSFDSKGRTMMGVKPEKAAETLWGMGVAVIGANCGRTLSETLTAVLKMRATVPEAVLMAKPNAGLPHAEGGELVYEVTPEIMADYARRFVTEAGVKIFGGCCGSTPEHIRAVAAVLKTL